MPGNQSVERAIWLGWIVFGWIVLILLAGLATLLLLPYVSPFIAQGSRHDLFATLFVVVAWPVVTLVFRFCIRHGLYELLWFN
jgi:chromate transport protein ChrA